MSRFSVGVQLQPQATTVAALRDAWKRADDLGVDSIWTWDHFYPLYGDPEAAHFECYTLLAAMAADTRHARLGALVTCNSYRNPQLLADMARTIDHISNGRFTLGLGAGWMERDYEEYGYEFGTAPWRLKQLAEALPLIEQRIAKLTPPPIGKLPMIIGGRGEKVTLRLVAEHAQGWNSFGPVEEWAQRNRVLDDWCARLGRDPAEVERTVAISADDIGNWQAYVDAGATHIILMTGDPFDFASLGTLLGAARA
jgi:probable F420-dependent oxidoreductase